MQPYYYAVQNFGQEVHNFGDALNGWLWPRLLPNIFDNDDHTLFVGIGTLLNDKLPYQPFKIIFGSGVGYGKRPARITHNWKIYCVRGPLSAKALGISPNLAITDAAALLRVLPLPTEAPCYKVSFMPHWNSLKYWDWSLLCERMGIHYIDPNGSTQTILQEIQRSHLLLTEAMHGAIVADALRIPWVPLRAYNHVLAFKWQDWCLSLGLEYQPVIIPALYQAEGLMIRLREKLQYIGLYPNPVSHKSLHLLQRVIQPIIKVSNTLKMVQTSKTLQRTMLHTSPLLSSQQAITEATTRLHACLEQFKADHKQGVFVHIPPPQSVLLA